ncbi:MAG: hypothetical protein DLM64_09655 [Solirubrobacterales bacterium]|nr:MAG: hypothetical protein DLM64_09655 [Solirubrobacterales bacterium]
MQHRPRATAPGPAARHRPRVTLTAALGPAVALGTVAVAGCCASLAFLLVRTAVKGLVFAGPYSALAPTDQLRCLAWIRQAGEHLLIADPYRAGGRTSTCSRCS